MSLFDEIIYSFTGTQQGTTRIQFERVCDFLYYDGWEKDDDIERQFHHGDCIGADEEVDTLARALKYDTYHHPCDIKDKRAFCMGAKHVFLVKNPIARNHDIVDAGQHLLACPKGPKEMRSGTWATVRYAQKLNRPITIIYPDGTVVKENQC